ENGQVTLGIEGKATVVEAERHVGGLGGWGADVPELLSRVAVEELELERKHAVVVRQRTGQSIALVEGQQLGLGLVRQERADQRHAAARKQHDVQVAAYECS